MEESPWRYGVIDRSGGEPLVIALPEWELVDQLAIARAVMESTTWGEFRERCRAAGDRVVNVSIAWEDEVDPEIVPGDDEPFDVGQHIGAEDRMYPPWIEDVMTRHLPASVRALSAHTAPYWVEFPPDELEELLDALAAEGITAVEDQASYDVLQAMIDSL